MRIIHILYELKFSGAEIMYVDAASLFQQKGCELTVVATGMELGEYASRFTDAGYEVIHRPIPPKKNFFRRIIYYLGFVGFLRKGKYDVVHIHTQWGMPMCAWLAGIPSVFTFHAIFPTHFYSYFYHCLLRWTAKKIFNCKFQSISDSVYNHELKLYHNRTTKIYNWYGSHRYYPALSGEKEKVRKELNIQPETLVLISVGGCSPNKRHSDIINSLPEIVQANPNTLYLHLGSGESENEETELVNKAGINEHVRFCGNQTDVRKFFIAADIYVMTSINEGLSLTTIEAMACQIPAILYDVTGLRDFNRTGENSILIPEDYNLLAKKVIWLHKYRDVGTKIALSAEKLVNETYSMEKNALQIYDLYNIDNKRIK